MVRAAAHTLTARFSVSDLSSFKRLCVVRLKVEVNHVKVFSNYPVDAADDFDDLRKKSKEEVKELLKHLLSVKCQELLV